MKFRLLNNIMVCLMLCFLVQSRSYAQIKPKKVDEIVQLSFGRSKLGSGDIRGFSFKTGYARYFHKRLAWSTSFGATIHDGEDEVKYDYLGRLRDGSIRYIVAGVQALFGVEYIFLRRHKHELSVSISGLARYQTSSLTNRSILYPIGTGLPFPVVQFDHAEPARTFAAGFFLAGNYYYMLSTGFMIGTSAAFQADLNSDVLSHLSLSIGKRF